MIAHALSVGGTCTGEHGIGIGKREAMLREHGSESVNVMRAIKRALDPDGLLNPGKIFLD
jgi:D-lactate dehydrogenase (cytochrome)